MPSRNVNPVSRDVNGAMRISNTVDAMMNRWLNGICTAQPKEPNVRFMPKHRIGRICMHVAAMIGDRQVNWHLAGIRREFARV